MVLRGLLCLAILAPWSTPSPAIATSEAAVHAAEPAQVKEALTTFGSSAIPPAAYSPLYLPRRGFLDQISRPAPRPPAPVASALERGTGPARRTAPPLRSDKTHDP